MLDQKFILLATVFLIGACSSSKQPQESTAHALAKKTVPKVAAGIENGCDILSTDESWREAFDATYKKYGVPLHVVMAIIHQESRFVYDAKSTSNAYGFPQAKQATWDWYIDKTGNVGADREHLPDAVDFIGWYLVANQKRTGVSKWDVKNQYLAYHEGAGGYLRNSHLQKPWLLTVADKVEKRAANYRSQLASCYQYPKA